jgi:UDP-sugar pyrophosphorylase
VTCTGEGPRCAAFHNGTTGLFFGAHPFLSLQVQVATDSCYLDVYIQQILAMQAASNALHGTSTIVPLAIMTSDDTDAATHALLEKHANFGAAPGQLTIMKQEKVAALVDNDAHMTMLDGEPYTLDTKPHGHGDVHQLLASTGLAAKWAKEGRKYIVFFQDTNALCFTVSIAAIGVSEQSGYDMNSVCVPRKAKDAVGAITRLVRADGTSLTVNVEYNQVSASQSSPGLRWGDDEVVPAECLSGGAVYPGACPKRLQLEPLFKATGHPEGDVNDPATGFSPYPGNINQLVLRVGPYAEVLARTGEKAGSEALGRSLCVSLQLVHAVWPGLLLLLLHLKADLCPSLSTPSTRTLLRTSSRSRPAWSA